MRSTLLYAPPVTQVDTLSSPSATPQQLTTPLCNNHAYEFQLYYFHSGAKPLVQLLYTTASAAAGGGGAMPVMVPAHALRLTGVDSPLMWTVSVRGGGKVMWVCGCGGGG